jgi:hypothetical protein
MVYNQGAIVQFLLACVTVSKAGFYQRRRKPPFFHSDQQAKQRPKCIFGWQIIDQGEGVC